MKSIIKTFSTRSCQSLLPPPVPVVITTPAAVTPGGVSIATIVVRPPGISLGIGGRGSGSLRLSIGRSLADVAIASPGWVVVAAVVRVSPSIVAVVIPWVGLGVGRGLRGWLGIG